MSDYTEEYVEYLQEQNARLKVNNRAMLTTMRLLMSADVDTEFFDEDDDPDPGEEFEPLDDEDEEHPGTVVSFPSGPQARNGTHGEGK